MISTLGKLELDGVGKYQFDVPFEFTFTYDNEDACFCADCDELVIYARGRNYAELFADIESVIGMTLGMYASTPAREKKLMEKYVHEKSINLIPAEREMGLPVVV